MDAAEFMATVEGSPAGTWIHCAGDLNVRADAAMGAAYAEASALGDSRIVLDFEHVGYINSTGIALIVQLLGAARADGRTVAAVSPTTTGRSSRSPGSRTTWRSSTRHRSVRPRAMEETTHDRDDHHGEQG
jgi:anti-anti-sigma factor